MAFISCSFSAPGVTTDIIAVIYKTTAPTTEVDRQVNTANALNPWNLVFTDIDPGTYIVRFHDSPDGTTLGNIRHDHWIDSVTNQVARERIWITVDGPADSDPSDGDTTVDLGLTGRQVTGVFKEGFRYLKPGIECNYNDPANVELLLDSNADQMYFNSGDVFVIELAALVTSSAPSGGSSMDTVKVQNGNENILTITSTADDLNKTHMISSTNTSQRTELPAVGGVSEGSGYKFFHDGGALINVHIRRNGTDVIRFRGADVTDIYLGHGEWVKMVKGGTKWYVVDCFGQWDRVGQRVMVDVVGPNMYPLDGTKLDGAVYKRLYAFGLLLPPSQTVIDGSWLTTVDSFNGQSKFTKRSLYVVDVVNEEIRVPDDLGKSYRALKNIGGLDETRVDNVPGGFQPWSVGPHDHPLPIDDLPGAGNRQSLRISNDSNEGLSEDDRTGLNNPGGENRVENVGQIPVVLI